MPKEKINKWRTCTVKLIYLSIEVTLSIFLGRPLYSDSSLVYITLVVMERKAKFKRDGLKETNFSPGLAKISTRSISGLEAAAARARHPPKDSPTRYMGLLGERRFSERIVFPTSFTRSEPWECTVMRFKYKKKDKQWVFLSSISYIFIRC